MPPVRRSDLLTRVVDDELIILDHATGSVHRLNQTATCIWQHCDGRHAPEDIAAELAARFEDTPEGLLDEVVETLTQIEQLGLLIPDPGPESSTD
jgi:hypothetical protein